MLTGHLRGRLVSKLLFMTVGAEPRFGGLKFKRLADLQPTRRPWPLEQHGRARQSGISRRDHHPAVQRLQRPTKVEERARILLSRASAAHLDAVGRSLPDNLSNLLPRHTVRAA